MAKQMGWLHEPLFTCMYLQCCFCTCELAARGGKLAARGGADERDEPIFTCMYL